MAKKNKSTPSRKEGFKNRQPVPFKPGKAKARKKGFPRMLIGIAAIFAVAAVLVFNLEHDGIKQATGQDNQKNSAALLPNTPVLTVDRDTIDYGDVSYHTRKAFSLVVTNAGSEVLTFNRPPTIEVVEGC